MRCDDLRRPYLFFQNLNESLTRPPYLLLLSPLFRTWFRGFDVRGNVHIGMAGFCSLYAWFSLSYNRLGRDLYTLPPLRNTRYRISDNVSDSSTFSCDGALNICPCTRFVICVDTESSSSEIEIELHTDRECDCISSADRENDRVLPVDSSPVPANANLFDADGSIDYRALLRINPSAEAFADEFPLGKLAEYSLAIQAPVSSKARPPAHPGVSPNTESRVALGPVPPYTPNTLILTDTSPLRSNVNPRSRRNDRSRSRRRPRRNSQSNRHAPPPAPAAGNAHADTAPIDARRESRPNRNAPPPAPVVGTVHGDSNPTAVPRRSSPTRTESRPSARYTTPGIELIQQGTTGPPPRKNRRDGRLTRCAIRVFNIRGQKRVTFLIPRTNSFTDLMISCCREWPRTSSDAQLIYEGEVMRATSWLYHILPGSSHADEGYVYLREAGTQTSTPDRRSQHPKTPPSSGQPLPLTGVSISLPPTRRARSVEGNSLAQQPRYSPRATSLSPDTTDEGHQHEPSVRQTSSRQNSANACGSNQPHTNPGVVPTHVRQRSPSRDCKRRKTDRNTDHSNRASVRGSDSAVLRRSSHTISQQPSLDCTSALPALVNSSSHDQAASDTNRPNQERVPSNPGGNAVLPDENTEPNIVILTDEQKAAFQAHQKREFRLLLGEVSAAWSFLQNPRKENALVNEPTRNPQVATLLHKGEKFMGFAFLLGLNVASKRARQHYNCTAGSFDGGRAEYYALMDAHNLAVLNANAGQ